MAVELLLSVPYGCFRAAECIASAVVAHAPRGSDVLTLLRVYFVNEPVLRQWLGLVGAHVLPIPVMCVAPELYWSWFLLLRKGPECSVDQKVSRAHHQV